MDKNNLPKLDRRVQFDERSRLYRAVAGIEDKPLRSKQWKCDTHLDQQSEGACVGHAWAHELAAEPKIVNVVQQDAFDIYNRARQIDPWPGECVDYETECLTRTGWKTGSDLQVGDEILTFDLETETNRWEIVEKVHRYKSKPYRIWSHRGFAAAVTDNHKWPVKSRVAKVAPFELVEMSQLRSMHMSIRNAMCSDLPEEAKYEDDFVELVAWVFCEGSYRPDSRRGSGVEVTQKVELDRVDSLFKRLGFMGGYMDKIGCKHWEFGGELARAVREVAPNKVPTMDFIHSLTQRQLNLFLHVCELADGSTIAASGDRQERSVFHQNPGPRLDAWLAIATLAGKVVSRSRKASAYSSAETWTVRKSNQVEFRKMNKSPYVVGDVWCPETKAGTFVARRGGSVFITGNSYSGTSVLAGIQAVQEILNSRGKPLIKEYRWAFGAEDVVRTLGWKGPVVLGIEWHKSQYYPDENGRIWLDGNVVGGHAILAKGIDIVWKDPSGPRTYDNIDDLKSLVTLHNSWGPDWGIGGDAWFTVYELDYLLGRDGEACVPMRRSFE